MSQPTTEGAASRESQKLAADERLTIGAFSRRSRLSLKALRLYDEMGLLPPTSVDEWTGYRYYRAD